MNEKMVNKKVGEWDDEKNKGDKNFRKGKKAKERNKIMMETKTEEERE